MFKIVDTNPAYSPVLKPRTGLNKISSLASSFEKRVHLSHELYLSDHAIKSQIFEHIGWGKKTPQNIVEQGGILLGSTFYDQTNQVTYGIVEQAIPGIGAAGTPAYLKMDHEIWIKMLTRADELMDQAPEKNFQVIGWYHTHPNSLSVFMSGTDLNTQRNFFSEDWQFAIVLNPHKKIWRAFYGREAQECKGYVFEKKNSQGFYQHSKSFSGEEE